MGGEYATKSGGSQSPTKVTLVFRIGKGTVQMQILRSMVAEAQEWIVQQGARKTGPAKFAYNALEGISESAKRCG
jgi:hypothetical protein